MTTETESSNHRRYFWLAVLLLLGLLIGWLMRPSPESSPVAVVAQQPKPKAAAGSMTPQTHSAVVPEAGPANFRPLSTGLTIELYASSRPQQLILRLPTEQSYQKLLGYTGKGVRVLDQMDRFLAVRVGFDSQEDVAKLLEGLNVTNFKTSPAIPMPSAPTGDTSSYVPVRDQLLPAIGVRQADRRWGQGVKVAVIDSGVVPHPGVPQLRESVALTPFPDSMEKTAGHGTAVASLVAQVAPAVEIMSIRVADETYAADAFALAKGILVAVEAHAQIINISMGTFSSNPLMEAAVLYAQQEEVVIVAASGNSQLQEAAYPAAYPGVVSVGATDASGRQVEFSNYGDSLCLTAPGYMTRAAWPGNQWALISGTSASAPVVAGVIAATMSDGVHPRLPAGQAAQLVMDQADEAGIPGPDSQYGFGVVDLGRVLNRDVYGLLDGAITDQRIHLSDASSGYGEIQVTIQNRGTVSLINAAMQIDSPAGTQTMNLTTLAPGAISTFSVPIRLSSHASGSSFQVMSSLSLGNAGRDISPENNQRTDLLRIP